jgi:redox-sensitive bicupin YhaK (pirin superfamily)
MLAARLGAGQQVELPSAPFVHLFVAKGAVMLEGAGELIAGDAVRLTNADGESLIATQPAEVLVWEMHARLAS